MSIIRLRNVQLKYEDRQILREVSFRLRAGERMGLVGVNGTGKTTVLRLILGQLEPNEGAVEVNAETRISYFSQFSELDEMVSVRSVLEAVFEPVRAIEAELEAIGVELSQDGLAEAEMDTLLTRQAALFEVMEHCDGWHYGRQITTVLNKLGFREEDRDRPLHELSGGWRNRAALAKILLERPDVLLLDEPTNYLDLAGVEWLDAWLKAFPGAAIIVSHDRHFLDSVVTRIVEIENYHAHEYAGGYSDYIRAKSSRIKTLERQFLCEEELLLYESESGEQRRAEAKQPDAAMRRRLANLKKNVVPRLVDTIVTDIYRLLHVPDKLLEVERLSKAYDGRALFDGVTFDLQKEERLAIVGPNGCGKSTLLKVLAAELTPDMGTVRWPSGVEFVDFNQVLAELDPKETVSHIVNVTKLALREPRKVTGRFLTLLRFSESEQKQSIGTLSGGQRARVALALCALSGAQVLVLDEPTNHLDTNTIQVLERTLSNFPGAVLFVSHDRNFIDNVATRMLVFDGETSIVRQVTGNWTIWESSVRE